MGSCLLHDSMVDSVILNLTVPWSVVIQSFFLLQSFLVVLVALEGKVQLYLVRPAKVTGQAPGSPSQASPCSSDILHLCFCSTTRVLVLGNCHVSRRPRVNSQLQLWGAGKEQTLG